jgi:hypothetical protein
MADLVINSLRGGQNDSDLPNNLAEDQAAVLRNVELYYASCGERRLGCVPYDMTGSGLTSLSDIVHLTEHFPTNDITQPEYWAIGATVNSVVAFARKAAGAATWSPVALTDAAISTAPNVWNFQSQELDGKLFFAYPSVQDRLHVWDGAQLRRTGLLQPPPPTAVDYGSGTFVTVRYYRVRYTEMSATVVVRRSEPSTSITFTPSGSGAGAAISRGALINEGETNWELEASSDGSFYFRIATIPIATPSFNDATDLTVTSYASLGPAAEVIGTYLLQPSAKYIIADADRLILGSHWTNMQWQSRVQWTPVFADPGAGNDERVPLSTGGDNYVDLDNYAGGGLTGLGQVTNGTFYAFKWSSIYKFTRTGDLTHAYDQLCLTKARGAVPGSIFQGIDEAGRACLYFTDPSVGPCMIGSFGMRDIKGLRRTWQRFTYNPNMNGIPARGVYYPDKQQAHFWVSMDGNDFPSYKFVLQVNELTADGNGSAGRGWTTADGTIATAKTVTTWHETTTDGTITRLYRRPFIGLPTPDFVQRCDVGDTDAGHVYKAQIVTKPYLLTGLLNAWGAMTTALLATANATARLLVSCVRDFGIETNTVPADLVASPEDETFVVKKFDDLVMSESCAIQFQIEDA